MKFKGIVATTALGALLVCGAAMVGVSPAHAATKGPSKAMKRGIALQLKAAQTAIQKGQYAAGIAKLNAMSGNKELRASPYAQHIRNQLYVFAYEKSNQEANLPTRLKLLLKDPYETPANVRSFVVALAQLSYQLHHYHQAIKYGTEALSKGYATEAQMGTLVAQAHYLLGDWRGTISVVKQQVAGEIKAGGKPTQHQLQLIESSCQKMHDQTCLLDSLEQLVIYYPQRQYWQYLLYRTFKTVKSNANLLEAYRLAFAVGVMKEPHEFISYAELAIEAGTPGEAETVLKTALKDGVFTTANSKAKAQRILQDAEKHSTAADRASLAHTAVLANKQATGNSDIRVGLAYYGYKQYPQAIKMYQEGIAKGGLKRPGEARLLLGIAQLASGNRAAALQAFGQVKGDPTLVRLAQLWSLKARSAAA
jgi:tetratricopeptide (TPR) repeat protein